MKKLGGLMLLAATLAGQNYHVIGRIRIGGEGGWDYLTLDNNARRLYVSHATHVVVVSCPSHNVTNAAVQVSVGPAEWAG